MTNTPDTEEVPTYKEIKEEIKKTDYFRSLDEDGNPPDTEMERTLRAIRPKLSTDQMDAVASLLSSRDTYWKERVSEIVQREIEATDNGEVLSYLERILDNLK